MPIANKNGNVILVVTGILRVDPSCVSQPGDWLVTAVTGLHFSPCWTIIHIIPPLKKERLAIFLGGCLAYIHIFIYIMIFSLQYIPYISLLRSILPFFGIQMCQPQLPAGQALRDSNKADLEKRLLEEQVSDSKAGTSLPEPIGPGRPRWGFCWKVDHEKCR